MRVEQIEERERARLSIDDISESELIALLHRLEELARIEALRELPTVLKIPAAVQQEIDSKVDDADLSEAVLRKVATVTGINAKTVATTELYAVPTGKTFIPMFVVIRVTAFTAGGKGTQAVASFGGNAATYDDFLNSVTYTVANADFFQTDGPADSTEVTVQAAGDSFRISIETGSDATTETWAVDVFGYLV